MKRPRAGISYVVYFRKAYGCAPAQFDVQFTWTYGHRYGFVHVLVPALLPVRGNQNPIRQRIAQEIRKTRKMLPSFAKVEADFAAAQRRNALRVV